MVEKRERDPKTGQYTNKDSEPRKVRSLRLTDTAWKKLGDKINNPKISRADIVEHFASDQLEIIAHLYGEYKPQSDEPTVTLTRKELEDIVNKTLQDLNVGKQSTLYRNAKKGMDKLIKRIFTK